MSEPVEIPGQKTIVRLDAGILRRVDPWNKWIIRECEDGEQGDLPGKYGPPGLYVPGTDLSFGVEGGLQGGVPIICTFNATTRQWEGGPQENTYGPGFDSTATISVGGPGIGGVYWYFAQVLDSTFYGPNGSFGYKDFGLFPCGSWADYLYGVQVTGPF